MRENRLRWFDHLNRRVEQVVVREITMSKQPRKKRGDKKTLIKTIKNDLRYVTLQRRITLNHMERRYKICVQMPLSFDDNDDYIGTFGDRNATRPFIFKEECQ